MWKQISLPLCCSVFCWEKNSHNKHTHCEHRSLKTLLTHYEEPPHKLYSILCWGLDIPSVIWTLLHPFITLQLVILQKDLQCCHEQNWVAWNNGSVDFMGQVASDSVPRTKDLQRRCWVLIHLTSLMMWLSTSRQWSRRSPEMKKKATKVAPKYHSRQLPLIFTHIFLYLDFKPFPTASVP